MKLGLFGGTFDPVHNGHIAVAEAVYREVNLSKILFIPAGRPWLKEGREITPAGHRLKMIELAISGKDYFELSTVEIERPGITYTVDTLTEIITNVNHTKLYLIMGWDTLADLACWKDPRRLLQLCYVVSVPRPGSQLPDLAAMEKELPGIKERVILLNRPEIDISSSDVREKIAENKPFEQLVPGPVSEYIKKNKLYLKSERD